jgi:hypothetical protein
MSLGPPVLRTQLSKIRCESELELDEGNFLGTEIEELSRRPSAPAGGLEALLLRLSH